MSIDFDSALKAMPVVAILRGVEPQEVEAIGEALCRAGIRIIEVPLNSPRPLDSIRKLADRLGESCVIGAGTVVDAGAVDDVVAAGGRLVVSPDTNADVIRRTLSKDAVPMPGVATATEAFAAYGAGARNLKLFPASTYGTSHLRALLAVLPPDVRILGVGGFGPGAIGEWLAAGARGIGMGSELYRPGDSPETVLEKATAVVDAINKEKSA